MYENIKQIMDGKIYNIYKASSMLNQFMQANAILQNNSADAVALTHFTPTAGYDKRIAYRNRGLEFNFGTTDGITNPFLFMYCIFERTPEPRGVIHRPPLRDDKFNTLVILQRVLAMYNKKKISHNKEMVIQYIETVAGRYTLALLPVGSDIKSVDVPINRKLKEYADHKKCELDSIIYQMLFHGLNLVETVLFVHTKRGLPQDKEPKVYDSWGFPTLMDQQVHCNNQEISIFDSKWDNRIDHFKDNATHLQVDQKPVVFSGAVSKSHVWGNVPPTPAGPAEDPIGKVIFEQKKELKTVQENASSISLSEILKCRDEVSERERAVEAREKKVEAKEKELETREKELETRESLFAMSQTAFKHEQQAQMLRVENYALKQCASSMFPHHNSAYSNGHQYPVPYGQPPTGPNAPNFGQSPVSNPIPPQLVPATSPVTAHATPADSTNSEVPNQGTQLVLSTEDLVEMADTKST